jgi:prephenate dehydrogenase
MRMRVHFNTVAIWGMGLLGGSLGMALRKKGMAKRIIGVGRNMERLEMARNLNTCGEITCDLAEGFGQADLAILCLPVAVMAQALPGIAPLFKKGAIVTDVGSTKRRIVGVADAAFAGGPRFVGSHPMSGAELSGVSHARADLYEDNPCFVTPTRKSDREAVEILRAMWTEIGSRVTVADPERHDSIVAAISHAPHLASAALALLAESTGETDEYLASVAGNGFWDTTRLAKGDLTMWKEICEDNGEQIAERLGELIQILSNAQRLIREGGDIEGWLAQARDARLRMDALREAEKAALNETGEGVE